MKRINSSDNKTKNNEVCDWNSVQINTKACGKYACFVREDNRYPQPSPLSMTAAGVLGIYWHTGMHIPHPASSCEQIHWQQNKEEEEEVEEEEEDEEEEENVWRMQSNIMILSAAKKSAVLSEIFWTCFSSTNFTYLSLLKKSVHRTLVVSPYLYIYKLSFT
jgi:hypothetical protein